MYLFFYAIATIPLAQATLVLLLPLFNSSYWLALATRLCGSKQTWLAIGLGFIGVFTFLDPMNSELSPVIRLAFLAAAFAAFTKTVIRRMSDTESTSKIVFYFSTLATIASGLPLLWLWQLFQLSTGLELLLWACWQFMGNWL